MPHLDISSSLVLNRWRDPRPRHRLLDPVDQGPARRRRRRHASSTSAPRRTRPAPRSTRGPGCDAVDAATDGPARAGRRRLGRRPAARHGRPRRRPATPVRDALLWNDTRSAGAARDLIAEMGGPQACADAIGSVLVASFTATKLRWLRDHEPDHAARVAAVLLPHDYVSLAPGARRAPSRSPTAATPPAPATSPPREGDWRPDLLELALGHAAAPAPHRRARRGRRRHDPPAEPSSPAAPATTWAPRSAWTSSPATSWSRSAPPASPRRSAPTPVADGTGVVTGFADASGGFLPMVTTMNAAGILDLQARWLGVDHDGLADARARVVARRRRRHPAALLRRRAHPQPSRRRRHLDRADPRHDPRRPRAGGVRGPALLARRRGRPPRRGHRRPAAPRAHGRRRDEERRPARPRPGRPRPPRRAAAAGRVRRPRRRPAGRLGARRHRRAARPGRRPRPRSSRPTPPPTSARSTPTCASAPPPGPRPDTDTEGTT